MSRVTKPETRRRSSRLSTTPLKDITTIMNNSSPPSSACSSQETPEPLDSTTPATSPLHTPIKQKVKKQSYFSIGSKSQITCKDCGMSYMKHLPSDLKLHARHHKVQLHGRDWNSAWGEVIIQVDRSNCIVQVKPEILRAKQATLELMEVVNTELNAPDDNEFWIQGKDSGVVYVYIRDGRAIGVVSVEKKVREGRWLSLEDGCIVSSKPVPLLAGINRVYVSKNYRRQKIGLQLLQAIRKNLIYGMEIPKEKIGWSQPSSAGAKLAAQFNALKHKSGKFLAPVYT